MKQPSGIGERMRRAREAKGLSQTELADKLRYSKYHLSNVEHERAKPSQELLEGYERELGLAPGTLLRQDALPSPFTSENILRASAAMSGQELLRASVIKHALEDNVPEVRQAAIQTLGLWHGEDVDAALAHLLSDLDASIRLSALRIIYARAAAEHSSTIAGEQSVTPSSPVPHAFVGKSPSTAIPPTDASPSATSHPMPIMPESPLGKSVVDNEAASQRRQVPTTEAYQESLRHTAKLPLHFQHASYVAAFEEIANVKPSALYAALRDKLGIALALLNDNAFFPSEPQLQQIAHIFHLTPVVYQRLLQEIRDKIRMEMGNEGGKDIGSAIEESGSFISSQIFSAHDEDQQDYEDCDQPPVQPSTRR